MAQQGAAGYHVAQYNLARLVAPLDDPRVAEFVAQPQAINGLGDRSLGFVWRLQTEDVPHRARGSLPAAAGVV